MEFMIPILSVGAIGCAASILLVFAAKFFAVKTDERIEKIRECLPGINCSVCGYANCDEYAKGIANGDVTTKCKPGGDMAAHKISEVLGISFADVEKQRAYVTCSGDCDAAKKQMQYEGVRTCAACNLLNSGEKACSYACLGYGDCVEACKYDAIHVINDIAVIDKEKCVGCTMCVSKCPNHLIQMIPLENEVVVSCSSHDKGAKTHAVCTAGCIACRKCEKICPTGAIKVEDHLASIDYSKCTNCKACVGVCPVKIIRLYQI